MQQSERDAEMISDDELERRMTAKLFGGSSKLPEVAVRRPRRRPGPSARDVAAQREAEMVTYVDSWEFVD